MADPFALHRFVEAQDPVMAAVEAELRAGRKRSHWMWFVFPQLRALGHSATALHFGMVSLDEARAYRLHPVLGPRLVACTALMLAHAGRSAHDILGSPDDLKLRSSMTLFAAVNPAEPGFRAVLRAFYDNAPDQLTARLLAEG
ncbi:DUF1810 domain-containing protein [Plastoroseomonas arctica]|nr:DUF1810 domain-containing protein [Plastoroseomonas arctica]